MNENLTKLSPPEIRSLVLQDLHQKEDLRIFANKPSRILQYRKTSLAFFPQGISYFGEAMRGSGDWDPATAGLL